MIYCCFFIIDFNNLGYNPVDKIPVMADNQYTSGIRCQESFQPGDARHIQVVGRLIKDDQIRSGQQQPSKCDPHLLTTG